MSDSAQPQLLHLVIGGELTDLEHVTFKDLGQVDIVETDDGNMAGNAEPGAGENAECSDSCHIIRTHDGCRPLRHCALRKLASR